MVHGPVGGLLVVVAGRVVWQINEGDETNNFIIHLASRDHLEAVYEVVYVFLYTMLTVTFT